ncbi:MAG: hypothetical protein DRJ56_00370 [Thermoprotei archaeon]|nr:MAG: hypothetical protein DRJ56_00370 [Thermoprotei archaeon]
MVATYYVVVCERCGRSKIVRAGVKTTTCPYCGSKIRVPESIAYTCDSLERARALKALIDSGGAQQQG